ncbi:unnamed protein product [Rotaria magnacalcarata]|uniref:guanylate kinase n=2 Tax=Rotaria magnacalcarata TaxID=392030 RepID=A0A815KBJ0_9BILA|nr:unnamed protein product [Rotaria magnacalcarata]CAF1614348.1 unnamed protein product [Rotaria magnacalcarata]
MALRTPKQPRTVVISGPSGSGKSTLVSKLLGEYPSTFVFTISHTTRRPRSDERNGREYHFIQRSKMEAMIANEEFVEWSEFASNLYGTSKATFKNVATSGCIWLRIVDKIAVKNIRETDHNALFICINPPSYEVLSQRLRDRNTDTETARENRLQEARESIQFSKKPGIYDYIIENDQLDVAYEKLKEILRPEIEAVLHQQKTNDDTK